MSNWDEITKLAREAGERLGIKKPPYNSIAHPDSHYEIDKSFTIMQLRSRVHELEIENDILSSELKGNQLLQQENLAVNDAWEKYQMVLSLAKEHK